MAIIDGLISYWKFNGNSTDSHGSLNGTDTVISYGAGKINNCAISNGSTSNITTGSTTQFNLTNMTIAFWIKPGASQSGAVRTILDYNHSINNGWTIQSENANTTGRYYFTWWNGTAFQGAGLSNGIILTPSVWQHICFTKSGTVVNGYLNGVLTWTFTGSGTLVAGNYPLTILNYQPTGRSFNGSMDELGIWNRAINFNEISEIYKNGIGLEYPFNISAGFLNFF